MEANEAFAAQAMSVNHDLGWDLSKVNVNGGAIAIGHPIGGPGPRPGLVALRDEAPGRQEGPRDPLYRRWSGVALAVERS